MSNEEKTRVRRTTEERVAEIDSKISALNEQIQSLEENKQQAIVTFDERISRVMEKIKGLEEKKTLLLSPKPPRKPRKTKKQKFQELMKQAQKAGMKPEEVADRLGLTVTAQSCVP